MGQNDEDKNIKEIGFKSVNNSYGYYVDILWIICG